METLIGILTWEFIVGLISIVIYNETSNIKVKDIMGIISILSVVFMIITTLIGIFIYE